MNSKLLLSLLVLAVSCSQISAHEIDEVDAVATKLPSHVRYLGCYKDAGKRDLNHLGRVAVGKMTPQYCYEVCRGKGYQYFGLQYMHYCFCGKSYGLYGKVPERQCHMKCSGNRKKICGATWRNSVYTTGIAHAKLPRHVRYLGCFTDKPLRDLRHLAGSFPQMTPMMCYKKCKNKAYKYFGVQYGTYCFCDNWYGKYKPKLPESACSMKCAGNRRWKCGATWKNNIYTTGLGGPLEPTTEGGDGTGGGHGSGTGGGHGSGTGGGHGSGGGTITETETTVCVDPYTGKEHAVGDSWTSKSGGFCYHYTCGKKHGQPVRTDCKDLSGRCVRATASGNKFSCKKGSCKCLLQGGHTYVRHRVTHYEK